MPSLGVSVLIPTYDRAHLLGRAVRCALAQITRADEIVIVDDGSTDSTAQVAREFGKAVRFHTIPHAGAGAARNFGVRMATKPLIAFLDSDDEWQPDKLALQRTFMERRPDVLFSFTNFAGRTEENIEPNYLARWHKDNREWDEILGWGDWYSSLAELPAGRPDFRFHVGSIYLGEMMSDYVATSTCMVRRAEAGRALRFADDIPISEDKECYARLAAAGPAAYLDCETSWQWGHTGPRVSDANAFAYACARIKIMERVWAKDKEFMAQHEAKYAWKLRQQQFIKARWLMARGRTPEARTELKTMGRSPLSYRLLASLPGFVARGVLKVRRAMGLGQGN